MLGDVLVSDGVITTAHLQQALAEQRTTGALLGETLRGLKLVSDEVLSRALAREAGVPFTVVDTARPDPAAVTLVPEPFARKRLVAPLAVRDGALQVVQANPFDVLALDELRVLTARPIRSSCATPADVRALLDLCYADRQKVRPEDQPVAPAPVKVPDVPVAAAFAQQPDNRHEPLRTLPELGLTRRHLTLVTELLDRSPGLVIVAGPPGSGTTTTLYAMLAHLASGSKHIVTIEDRVERRISTIRQMELEPDGGFTYATATRVLLRLDPAAIMIGDVSDPEVAQMAVLSAASGPLVLTTVPAANVAGALDHVRALGIEPYRLASALTGIVAQRLVRRLCPDCSEPVTYPADMLERIGLTPDPVVTFHRGRGCEHCLGTGYRDRIGVFEILRIDGAIETLLRDGADSRTIRRAAGMTTIVDDALTRAIFQQTTLEEVLDVADR
jgi:Type II/IV secretion system protein/MshEN domain